MKINWKYLKKTPVIIGGIILFFIVLFLLNRGQSSGNTATGGVVTSNNAGPSDAAIMANTNLQMAGIAASVENNRTMASLEALSRQGDIAVALKSIDANVALTTTAAQAQIAALGIAAQNHAADLAYGVALNNNQLAFNTAKMAYDNANYSTAINAGVMAHISDNQLEAYKVGTLANVIPTLKSGQRDNAFEALLFSTTGSGGSYNAGGSNAVYVPPSNATGSVTYAPPPLPQTNWVF